MHLDRTIESKERLISREFDANPSSKGRNSAVAVQLLWGWRRIAIAAIRGISCRQSPTVRLTMPAYANILVAQIGLAANR